MGKGNVAVRQFIKNKKRFADMFNAKLFQGRQVIRAEDLEEIDSESDILLEDKDGKRRAVQRYRDVVMRWKDCIDLVIFACENQAKIHYAMPVRNMIYDGLSYMDQIKQLWDTHEGNKDTLTQEEYLSRFRKNDKIYPVITLVWYFGTELWDGSINLHDMFGLSEDSSVKDALQKFVPNYWINLIDAQHMEDINQFQTDLQQIFGMLKCMKDKRKLRNYIRENKDYFQNVDEETYFAIEELLQTKRLLKETVKRVEKGAANMYDVIEELYQDAVKEGIEQGIEQGVKGLVNLCKEFGKTKQDVIAKIVQELNIDTNKASDLVEKYWK